MASYPTPFLDGMPPIDINHAPRELDRFMEDSIRSTLTGEPCPPMDLALVAIDLVQAVVEDALINRCMAL